MVRNATLPAHICCRTFEVDTAMHALRLQEKSRQRRTRPRLTWLLTRTVRAGSQELHRARFHVADALLVCTFRDLPGICHKSAFVNASYVQSTIFDGISQE